MRESVRYNRAAKGEAAMMIVPANNPCPMDIQKAALLHREKCAERRIRICCSPPSLIRLANAATVAAIPTRPKSLGTRSHAKSIWATKLMALVTAELANS